MSRALAGPLAGCELVVFDKDGTLIEFHAMWGGWTAGLVRDLVAALSPDDAVRGARVRDAVYKAIGVDPATGIVDAHGALAATPMAVLRQSTVTKVLEMGLQPEDVENAVAGAWHAPDPVTLAVPLTDLGALFGRIHLAGGRVAVATSDDREPTERTFAALGVLGFIDASVCADDGVPVKPAPHMLLELCRRTGIAPDRTAMIGDSAIDLRMGRAAGVARSIGVLSGTGTAAELAPLADTILASVAELVPAD